MEILTQANIEPQIRETAGVASKVLGWHQENLDVRLSSAIDTFWLTLGQPLILSKEKQSSCGEK